MLVGGARATPPLYVMYICRVQQMGVLSLGTISDAAVVTHPILVTDDPSVPFYASPAVPCTEEGQRQTYKADL